MAQALQFLKLRENSMNYEISLQEDMHVHSTYSDGVNSIEENIKQAESVGLKRFCCVDHVRRDTDWLGNFAANIDRLKNETEIEIFSGVETKLLNIDGDLDMPQNLKGIDFIYVADHQFPMLERPYHPKEIRQLLQEGKLNPTSAIEILCQATMSAMKRFPNVVIAHLFSILPKIGLNEEQVPENLLQEMADTAKRFNVKIEIDERWKCPTYRTVSYFKSQNVPIWFSTDSHRKETIGQYSYNAEVYQKLL